MFSLDSAVKHIDADGDEIMCSTDYADDLVLSEEMLKQVEVRKGAVTSHLLPFAR
jgi:hypothetical protein